MKKYLIAILILSTLVMPVQAFAQATSFSIENIGSSVGLGTSDLKSTVINISTVDALGIPKE